MDRRLKLSIAAAGLVLAGSVPVAWRTAAPQFAEAPVRLDNAVLESCLRAAELLFDITWAAACTKTDDDAVDCTLPETRAAPINAAFNADRAQCLAAARQR